MKNLLIHKSPPVNKMTLNRPDKKNALNSAMYKGLTKALKDGEDDNQIKLHLITGAGDFFCAGNDITDFIANSQSGGLEDAILPFLFTLARLTKPLVFIINGPGVGVGTTMLAYGDYIITCEDSWFQTPFVKLGLVPEAASSLLFPALFGRPLAFELLVMGRKMPAQKALACGLINKIAPRDRLEEKTSDLCHEISQLPTSAVKTSKQLLRPDQDRLIERIELEAKLFTKAMSSKEARRAFAAFMNKA